MTLSRRKTPAVDRMWWLAAVVFAPFVLLSMLLWDSIRNEDARRETESRVLADYGDIAVRQLRRKAESQLHSQLDRAFRGVMHPPASPLRHALPVSLPLTELLARARGDIPIFSDAVTAFRFDIGTGELTFTGLGYEANERAALTVLLRTLLAEPEREPHRLIVDSVAGRPRLVALFIVREVDQPALHILGIEADAHALGRAFHELLQREAILPSALLGPPYDRSVLYATVHSARGAPIMNTPAPEMLAEPGVDSLPAFLGGALMRVYAGPGLAAALRIGRPSPLYMPVLVALQILSLLLAVAALLQMRRIRDVSRMREQFVANVSHELRTPLAHMSMFAEMLADSRPRSADKQHEYATILHRETRRLAALVERALNFARSQRALIRVSPEPRELRADILEIVRFFEPLACGTGRPIIVDASAPVSVHTDPDAVRQILLNLLDNALKHGEGPIGVRLRRVVDAAHVSVTDHGRGIPAGSRQRVFEPFVRLDDPGAPATSGAGIGLSVVRELVRALGGRVWVEANPGGGTQVTFSIPADAELIADGAAAS